MEALDHYANPQAGVLSFQNLRPIFLTSCMDKHLEHILQDRVNGYLEQDQLYPSNMLSSRPNL